MYEVVTSEGIGVRSWCVKQANVRLSLREERDVGFESRRPVSLARAHAELLNREIERGGTHEGYGCLKCPEDLETVIRDFEEVVLPHFHRLKPFWDSALAVITKLGIEQDAWNSLPVVQIIAARETTERRVKGLIEVLNLWKGVAQRKTGVWLSYERISRRSAYYDLCREHKAQGRPGLPAPWSFELEGEAKRRQEVRERIWRESVPDFLLSAEDPSVTSSASSSDTSLAPKS